MTTTPDPTMPVVACEYRYTGPGAREDEPTLLGRTFHVSPSYEQWPLVLRRDADAAIAALRERLEAAEKDAARYRVLRAEYAQELCENLYGQDTPIDMPADWGRELDEWLDASIAASKGAPDADA